jgi:hypothetical protein
MAVAGNVVAWFQKNVFEQLDGNGSPRKRVRLSQSTYEGSI